MSDYRLISIKEIQRKSILKKFDCGIEKLNEFLSRYAIRNDELGIGRTFVALNNNDHILDYFTLATAQVAYQEIPDEYKGKLPKYPIPALRIARIAVNKELQGNRVGKWLLSQVFTKAVQVSDITGLYLIIVDAKETSKSFYEYYGFQRLVDEDLSYFVVVDTIRKAIQG